MAANKPPKKKSIPEMAPPADGVLQWDRPKRAMPKEEWKEAYGFDGGPVGGFMPNMSKQDAERWKAKLSGTRTGFPQVEIRRQCGPSLMLIIVNLGAGYSYKGRTPAYDVEATSRWTSARGGMKAMSMIDALANQPITCGTQIHVSMNGPSLMDFDEMADMQRAIAEARSALEALETAPGTRTILHAVLKDGADVDGTTAILNTMPGVRIVLESADAGLIVLSAPEDMDRSMVAVEGVSEILSIKEFQKRGRRAVNVAYGFPPDEDEDDEEDDQEDEA
jgi:hypothetical protein